MSYSYDELYENICRLCFSYNKSDNMVTLVDETNNINHHARAIMLFANITILSNDDLPRKMCSMCLFLLKQAIIFKQNCESSDNQFKKLKTISNSLQSLKETVVQHWMYKLYFPTELKSKSCQETKRQSNFGDNGIVKKTKSKNSEQRVVFKCSNEESKKANEMNENYIITSTSNFDQSPCKKTESNDIQNIDNLLDVIESMVPPQTDTRTDNSDFIQSKEKRVLRRRNFFKHIQVHKKRNKSNISVTLECKMCNKVLANPMTYRQHMQRHTGCHYICEHCGKGFPVRAELNIHRVARHGTGPFLQCQHCSFKAPRKFDLIEHLRVHTGERPYTCDKCGLTFRRRGIWRRHMIYHTEKNVQCTRCPRKFYQRSAMLAHSNNVHDRLYVYLCNKCGVTYTKPATVRRHLTERHGIPREMQGKIMRVNKSSGCNTLHEYKSVCVLKTH